VSESEINQLQVFKQGAVMNISVGPQQADICGVTGVAIQAALDRVSAMGGGEVAVAPGEYLLQDAVHIPTGTTLRGAGAETVLRKADGWEAPLWEDCDWGDCWIGCDPLPPVQVGQGVTIWSDNVFGFLTTVGTVLEIDGNRFRVSKHFNMDTMVCANARVANVFPLISVEQSTDIAIRDLVLDGNAAHNPRLNGCRGAGVFGLFSARVQVSNVTVRQFNGDAISFQQSHDWLVEDCLLEDNTGGGMHPGSGSQRPIIRRCTARRNGGAGLFVCWRVKHGRFEENRLEDNGSDGISVGHKDSDNLFRENQILRNGGVGIQIREETFPMAPHRCRFEGNTLSGNNHGGPQVMLHGDVHDLAFLGNHYDEGATRFATDPRVINALLDEEFPPVRA